MEGHRPNPGGLDGGRAPRLLFAADRLSALGGADRHLLAVLNACRRGGFQCHLAVGFDDKSLPEPEREGLGGWARLKGLDRSGMAGRGGAAARRRLARAARDFRPGLIHMQNVMDPALLETAAGLAPLLVTVQDHRFFCPGRGKVRADGSACRDAMGQACRGCFSDPEYGLAMLELTRRRLAALGRAARVLVLSAYMKNELAAAGLAREKIEVIPPFAAGLGPAPAAGPGGYHLLACRLVKRKGVRVALAAAGLAEAGLPLVVAGDGRLKAEVARAAENSGGRVRFVGWAHRPRMARLLAGAASLWLPSLWAEPFGIVGLEAMAMGRPVVAARVGGVEDWLKQGKNGLLVPAGDAVALAGAAGRLARDPELAARLGAAGQKTAREHFGEPALMAALQKVYRETLA